MVSTARQLTNQFFKNLDDDERALLANLLIAVKDNLQEIETSKKESDDESDGDFLEHKQNQEGDQDRS